MKCEHQQIGHAASSSCFLHPIYAGSPLVDQHSFRPLRDSSSGQLLRQTQAEHRFTCGCLLGAPSGVSEMYSYIKW